MSLFDRMSAIEDRPEGNVIPKGKYAAVVESAVLQNHPQYGDNVNWAFRLVDTRFGAGRKVFSTCYLDPPTDPTKKDPIWRLKKHLSGLGIAKDAFPKSKEELAVILEAAIDQPVTIDVTSYTSNGKTKNDAFIVAIRDESDAPEILRTTEEQDVVF